jgi:hypothetical protein
LRNVFDRDAAGKHAMRLSYAIVALLAFHVTAHGADAADALAKLDTNGNHIVEEAEAMPVAGSFSPISTRTATASSSRRN